MYPTSEVKYMTRVLSTQRYDTVQHTFNECVFCDTDTHVIVQGAGGYKKLPCDGSFCTIPTARDRWLTGGHLATRLPLPVAGLLGLPTWELPEGYCLLYSHRGDKTGRSIGDDVFWVLVGPEQKVFVGEMPNRPEGGWNRKSNTSLQQELMILLAPGEEVVIEEVIQKGGGAFPKVTSQIVRNLDGLLVTEDPEKEAKRAYAREVFNALCEEGLHAKCVRALFAVCGPSGALEALQWVKGAFEALGGNTPATRDALDCVLKGARGTNYFGKDRQCAVLAVLGLPTTGYKCVGGSGHFFRVLEGAHMLILGWGEDDASASEAEAEE